MYKKVAISSPHSKYVSGANSLVKEVDEGRKVVTEVERMLKNVGCTVHRFDDNTSRTQNENLSTIVNFHNSKDREVDVSVHFNAATRTSSARGVEVYYYAGSKVGKELAEKLSAEISRVSGLKNRGAKDKGLTFTSKTTKTAVLIEVAFVDSDEDVRIYKAKFSEICGAISKVLSGKEQPKATAPTPSTPPTSINQSPTFSSSGSGTYKVVCSGSLNVRSDAGTQFKVVGQLKSGQTFKAIGSKSGWLKINNGQYVSGNTAYVRRV